MAIQVPGVDQAELRRVGLVARDRGGEVGIAVSKLVRKRIGECVGIFHLVLRANPRTVEHVM